MDGTDGNQDKRRLALDQTTGVIAKYVERQIKSDEDRDPDVREAYGGRLRRGDLERLRVLSWEERGEGGKGRAVQSLLDEALDLLFASREIDPEQLGLRPTEHRAAALQLMAKRKKA